MNNSCHVIHLPVAQWRDLDPRDVAAHAMDAQQREGREAYKAIRAAALETLTRRMRRARVSRDQHQNQIGRWLYNFDEACSDLRKDRDCYE